MICKSNDSRELYYEVKGKSDAPETLVFLNGLTQSTLSWAFVIPFFIEHYKIILLDFIFQGQSEKRGEYKTFDEHAQDVVTVLDQENISKAHIIGLSYGSMVAQHFAVNHPNVLKTYFTFYVCSQNANI
jgi:3-oxoadipate enol-lactonase